MSQQAVQLTFGFDTPTDERRDAAAELQKAHMPTASDLIPNANVRPVIDYIQAEYEQQRLAKAAQIIPFPGRQRDIKHGMQSVYLDTLQIFAHGDYFERPSPIGFETLRQMVDQTPVLNAVIMTRIRQVERFAAPQDDFGPGFLIAHVDKDHKLTKQEIDSVRLLQKFITNCGWEFNPRRRKALKRDNFGQFLAKFVRESLTYDAAPIETEMKRDRQTGIDGFYALDGTTVRLCTDEGYRGDDAVFALQVINGQPVTAYTHDDLIYEARNPRADVRLAGYGLGETELLIKVVTGFLNAMTYNQKGFDDNSIPKGILHLVGEYSQEDMIAFRRYWNSMVRGINNAWSLPVMASRDENSKVAFERLGVEYNEMYFAKWMTFLVSIICAIYGMSPAEINFDSFTAGATSALSGSDTSEKLAASRDSGLRPLMAYLENLISDFIISDFGEKYVFRWAGLDEDDPQQRAEMRKLCMTLNEARAQENLPPIKDAIGEAPINPSLVGPWLQMQQPPEGEGEPQEDEEGHGADPENDANDGEDDADQGQKNDEQGAPTDIDPEDVDALHDLAKANPYHDVRGFFSTSIEGARKSISQLLKQWRDRDFSGRANNLMPVATHVQDELARAGMDVSGYHHAADVYAIQHVFDNHGDEKTELSRGQLPITDGDILAIPDVVTSPDYLATGIKTRVGLDIVAYFKRMPDGSLLHLEEKRGGRRQLALQSMRKYPATIDAASVMRADNLNARSDGGDNFNLVDMRNAVKAIKEDSLAKAVPLIWAVEA